MSSIFDVKEHIIDAAYVREYPRATSRSQEEVLKIAVKEYAPKDNPSPKPGDVTIIGAHANGFPKELYEALWEDLHAASKQHGFAIRSILILDVAWQGQSGILNEDKLGNDPSWMDYARDVSQLINTLRPPLPIFGVGHSFGSAALVTLAHSHPRLVSALVLLDPVISRYSSTPGTLSGGPAAASLRRRDLWDSRAAAEASFAKSPFYAAWDPRVLRAWTAHGLRETPTLLYPDDKDRGKATLTTTKHHEIFTFLRPSWPAFDPSGHRVVDAALVPDMDVSLHPEYAQWPFYRAEGPATLALLPSLRPPVLYVFGGVSNVSHPDLRQQKMEATGRGVGGSGGQPAGCVEEVLLEDRGHLLPMEVPGVCAAHAARWIGRWMGRWRAEQATYDEWTKGSLAEKTTVGEEWFKFMPRPERAPRKNDSKI